MIAYAEVLVFLFVHCLLAQEVVVLGCGVVSGLLEELFGALGEAELQGAVANLAHDEVVVVGGRSLAVNGERILALGLKVRVEAEEVPVACLDGCLGGAHALAHAVLGAVVDAGSVGDDEGGTLVGLGLADSLDGLIVVGTHADLGDVNVTVGDGDLSQILLLYVLAGCCELRNSAGGSGLGSLTAGVGVNLGIEDEDVDVLVGSQNMVNTAEANIVCPAVATEDPGDKLPSSDFL